MTEPEILATQASLLELLDKIEALLGDVREKVIDGDPEMQESLRKAHDGDD